MPNVHFGQFQCFFKVLKTNFEHQYFQYRVGTLCNVTDGVYPGTMITIRHCSILEFGRGARNQAVTPGITRPLHAIGVNI